MNYVVSKHDVEIQRTCRRVKAISVAWAPVKAIHDVDHDCVPDKPYPGWELREEREIYIRKVNELRAKNEH